MSGSMLLIVEARTHIARGVMHQWRSAVMDAGFDPDAAKVISLDSLLSDPGSVADATLVWLVTDEARGNLTYEAAAILHERHKPSTITRLGNTSDRPGALYDDCAVLLPETTGLETVRAVLGTLRSQSHLLLSLSHEARLLRLHQMNVADHLGKLDEELRMAVKIQREFLPKSLPKAEPYRFDVLWRPAHYVSGDIYDIARLDESHVGIFIADAVGHGVPAALMTIYIKQSLQTKEISDNRYRLLEPRETLTQLNRRLLEQDSGSACFATAAYAVLNIKTGVMKMARAGHPFPMLFKDESPTQQLSPEGPMLGVFETDEFDQYEFEMSANDRLVMYSDGFEMAFPETESCVKSAGRTKGKIATTRYLGEFEVLRGDDIAQSLEKIAVLLDAESGSLNQRDDLTMLCVSRQAVSASAALQGAQSVAA